MSSPAPRLPSDASPLIPAASDAAPTPRHQLALALADRPANEILAEELERSVAEYNEELSASRRDALLRHIQHLREILEVRP